MVPNQSRKGTYFRWCNRPNAAREKHTLEPNVQRAMHGYRRHASSPLLFSDCYLMIWLLTQCLFWVQISAASNKYAARLKEQTEDLFFHGYENYMKHAFPEDELRPISCEPLTRDRENIAHVEMNDALGNYSLTLIDSLSTLAILASSPSKPDDNKPLRLFQDGIKDLVEHYGDGTDALTGIGSKARGFDLDSRVQVFETVIRGLGGLLSAHLFAVGDLPIRGYSPYPVPSDLEDSNWQKGPADAKNILAWDNGFSYNGQLLRLAHDLGQRLLPAFWTSTGIPYPRVNLRTGIPFYTNSPYNNASDPDQCIAESGGPADATETCSAGAGSLVLEFTVLSRLTGDPRFEDLAKRAFWAIWNRRSEINLLGAGIDAETGIWLQPYSGIGAGIDSFFEYAFKSFVLLSNDFHPNYASSKYHNDPRSLFAPLSHLEQSPDTFLQAWETAHAAARRHLLRGSNYQHPHYIVGDLNTGAARAFWIDALSAFYPGLLTMSGHVEEAVETHLLATAVWTRFSALPERWNLVTGGIEGGLGWWVGRPEFIESNYYLYRATEDPWYQYVAEMVLRDIKRRCWAPCGWSGIQNVLTGEKSDRMESFFLGETAKYLFLTFDMEHPLNKLDAAFIFSTEGHPLVIPRSVGSSPAPWGRDRPQPEPILNYCPARPPSLPLTVSTTAARGDVYHAGSLARLHFMPQTDELDSMMTEYAADHPSIINPPDTTSPSNYTYFPWTLPPELVPFDAISTMLPTQPTFDISFPSMPIAGTQAPPLQRVKDGILINSLAGLRLSMVQDVPFWVDADVHDGYRVHSINSMGLGKDEKVFLARDTGMGVLNPADPDFTRIRDMVYVDLIVEVEPWQNSDPGNDTEMSVTTNPAKTSNQQAPNSMKAAWESLVSQITNLMQDSPQLSLPFSTRVPNSLQEGRFDRFSIPGITPTGIGAALLPDWIEAPSQAAADSIFTPLGWTSVYATEDLCSERLSQNVPRRYQVIIVKRGNCSFSQKLSNIPAFAPSAKSLQLVIVVNYKTQDEGSMEELLFRPLLDQVQKTSGGLPKQRPLPMVMVAGGAETYDALRRAHGIGLKRRYSIRSQGVPITNMIVV